MPRERESQLRELLLWRPEFTPQRPGEGVILVYFSQDSQSKWESCAGWSEGVHSAGPRASGRRHRLPGRESGKPETPREKCEGYKDEESERDTLEERKLKKD